MTTINKQHISELILMELYADLHKVQDRIAQYEKKYAMQIDDFEKMMKEEEEDFEKYDHYIEWKAYLNQLKDLRQKIKDIKSGNYQVS